MKQPLKANTTMASIKPKTTLKHATSKADEAKGVRKMVQSKFEFEEHPSKIREARVMKQISQNEMAKNLSRAHTTYGEIERCRRPVHQETAEKIAKILSKKVIELFDPAKRGKFLAKRVS